MLHELPADIQHLLVDHVQDVENRHVINILFSGKSGSGRTTLMNYMINQIDEKQRAVFVVNQPDEFHLESPRDAVHLIYGESVSHEWLLRQAGRMRPDWIISDELRDEAAHAHAIMGVGNINTMGTIHAASATEALNHLTNLIALHKDADPTSASRLVNECGYLVIHTTRKKSGHGGYISEITQLHTRKPGVARRDHDATTVVGGNVHEPRVAYDLETLYSNTAGR